MSIFNPRNICMSCDTPLPKTAPIGQCRCCAADEKAYDETIGANTLETLGLMPIPPDFYRTTGFPRLEIPTHLWWQPTGDRFIVQHPLEYPIYRLSEMNQPGFGQTAA